MSVDQTHAILISDFNLDIFSGYLKNDSKYPKISPRLTPFGQVNQVLLDENMECWKQSCDVAIVWTRPEGVIDSFRQALDFKRPDVKNILEDVDIFSDSLMRLTGRVKVLFVPTWTLLSDISGFGMLERKPGIGLTDLLSRMNLRLAENMEKSSNAFLLDADRWIKSAGSEPYNPKLWYMGKVPFSNPVFKQSVKEIKSALASLKGNAKKIILVDLDDTLWGGSVGEVGWSNLKLGGHDPLGESFTDFQKALKSMTRRGILLGIISKNEEKVALEAIDKHPEMVLKREDFVGWRINWTDKAENILSLIKELKLGIQSTVFIDDNPVERDRIREAIPEILVPEWPKDKMSYSRFLLGLTCFNTPVISQEDSERTKMYQTESQRTELKKKLRTLDEWLKTLETKVVVQEINENNKKRASQLFNKTNQMNLSTRRMTEKELLNWVKKDSRRIWIFEVSDKFGDSGIAGMVGVECNENEIHTTDFILSCRVMGRKIEESMLFITSEYGRSLNLKTISAHYLSTKKNQPCYTFLKQSGFKHDENTDTFTWNLKTPYPKPDCITIINQSG